MSPESISNPRNARVQRALRLRTRRGRNQQGRTILDGQREIVRALEGGVRIEEVFCCDRADRTASSAGHLLSLDRVLDRLRQQGATLFSVPPAILDRLAFGERNEGLVAVATIPASTLDRLPMGKQPLWIVLDGVEKPGNLGAVLRSADGAGAQGVIVCGEGTDVYNPNVIRASLGTVFAVPTAVTDAVTCRKWLQQQAARIVVGRAEAVTNYSDCDFRVATAIVLGSEAHGASDVWRGTDCRDICIPMHGIADSLNVSAAAAVLLYEARRQRKP